MHKSITKIQTLYLPNLLYVSATYLCLIMLRQRSSGISARHWRCASAISDHLRTYYVFVRGTPSLSLCLTHSLMTTNLIYSETIANFNCHARKNAFLLYLYNNSICSASICKYVCMRSHLKCRSQCLFTFLSPFYCSASLVYIHMYIGILVYKYAA